MKVQYQLQGKFHRIQLSGTKTTTSVVDLIREVQAIATQNHRRTPQLLRQSFGLNFLPEPVLINLLQQSQGVVRESELYQVPSLQLLHSIQSDLESEVVNTYRYEFTCSEVTLTLTPDDSQLPFWTGNDVEKLGIYTITLEEPNYPGLSDEFTKNIWQQARNSWELLPESRKIHIALQSLDSNILYSITTKLKIFIELQDLSLDSRAAISFLRLGDDVSILSEPVKLLVQQYRTTYNSLPILELPQQLKPNETLPGGNRLFASRKNRFTLEQIISRASKFLLISSYIIEDESLTEIICKKAQELPQGVWILTDLRNEVLDKIDVQVVNSRTEYQRSDERKKACLRMLLDANIPIRSGAFHLKTYISEQYAYLGSCNLTGGSLDFNIEAGIVSCNNTHTQLINLFQEFWQQRSRDEVIPTLNSDGFHLRSIHHFSQQKYQNYPNLLTPSLYKKDLLKELRNFNGQVQIYSRSFQPSPEIEQYLRLLNTQIFVDSQMRVNNSTFNIKKINNLHAKITLLGNQVAYIGGINFNFGNNALSLNDLMYKTTNSAEISQIRKNLVSLNS